MNEKLPYSNNQSIEYNFRLSQIRGREVERLVKAHVICLKEHMHIQDYTDWMSYQKLGIDFIWHRIVDGKFNMISFDVKADFKYEDSGNLFLETHSIYGKAGGYLSTQADYFFHVLPYTGKMFRIPVADFLQKWDDKINPKSAWKLTKEIKPVRVDGSEGGGFLISETELLRDLPRVTVENIDKLDPKAS